MKRSTLLIMLVLMTLTSSPERASAEDDTPPETQEVITGAALAFNAPLDWRPRGPGIASPDGAAMVFFVESEATTLDAALTELIERLSSSRATSGGVEPLRALLEDGAPAPVAVTLAGREAMVIEARGEESQGAVEVSAALIPASEGRTLLMVSLLWVERASEDEDLSRALDAITASLHPR